MKILIKNILKHFHWYFYYVSNDTFFFQVLCIVSLIPVFGENMIAGSSPKIFYDFVYLIWFVYLGISIITLISMCLQEPVAEKLVNNKHTCIVYPNRPTFILHSFFESMHDYIYFNVDFYDSRYGRIIGQTEL